MSYADLTISEFLDEIASTAVVPAGGSAAAVTGATGAALCEMACIHTIEKDEHDDVTANLAAVRDDLGALRVALLELADDDAATLDALLSASTDEEVEAASKDGTRVPLETAEGCLEVVEHAGVVTEAATPNAVPDAVIGAFLAQGALRAAVYTVRTNLGHLDDQAFVEEVGRRAAAIETTAGEAAERVSANAGADR